MAGGGGSGGVTPGDLLPLMLQILELLTSQYPSGQFSIEHRCPTDEEATVLSAPWGGGFGAIEEVNRKVEALAELLQHHKTLPVTECKKLPNVWEGTDVTVTCEDVASGP